VLREGSSLRLLDHLGMNAVGDLVAEGAIEGPKKSSPTLSVVARGTIIGSGERKNVGGPALTLPNVPGADRLLGDSGGLPHTLG
jgi:hypothetical protein